MLNNQPADVFDGAGVDRATTARRPKIVWFGSTRYSRPLDPTTEKKFAALAALGDLYVIGFSTHCYPQRFTEHAKFYLLPELPWSLLRYGEIFLLGSSIACWLILKQGARLLVAQSPYEGFAAALAKRVASWCGVAVALIIESHGDFERSFFLYHRVMLRRTYKWLMRRAAGIALRNADCLRAVSDATKNQLLRWEPDKAVAVFLPWTDLDVFVEAGIARRGTSFSNVLFAGVLTPLKGVHHLIEAFVLLAQEFSHTRLVIIGRQDDEKYVTDLRQRVSSQGLANRVYFKQPVAQTELAALMSSAAVLVLPSLSEGLGRVILEAMATGTAVIGSRVGGIPDLVQDGVTGFLVPPGDAGALADKIRWVLTHPEEAGAVGQRARAYAQRRFSAQAYAQGYRQIFNAARFSIDRRSYATSTF